MMPACQHCGADIAEFGGIWRHANALDHEVWCGPNLELRVTPEPKWPRTNNVHRCLAITEEGPWCANMTELGRSYCTHHLNKLGVR